MNLTRRKSGNLISTGAAVVVGLVMTGCAAGQGGPAPIPNFVELVQAGMEEDAIPGVAVVVVDSGRIVMNRGFGVADLATGRSVDPDSTLFRLGSVTKVLTALGVLRLAERDAVALDTPVQEIVSLPVLDAGSEDPIRITHLLSHTGGFDQTGLGRHAPSADERPSLQGFLSEHLVPIRPPGTVATYDTYGISLAGLVIEAVSGMTYADFMREQVFEPLGMGQTFIEAPNDYRDRLAVGYGLDAGTHIEQPYEWYTTLPASSADATASDVARLMLALLDDGATSADRFLRPETLDALREGAFSGPINPFWFGWWVGRSRGRPVLYHGGVMRGFSTQLILLPDRGAGFFVAYNRDPETGPAPQLRDRLTSAFLDHMLGSGPDREVGEHVDVPTQELDGWWVSTSGCFTCRAGEGWPLQVERIESIGPGEVRFRGSRWLAEDSLTFRRENSGASLRFVKDDAKRTHFANASRDGFERLDADLVERVSESMGPGREPEALRARLALMVTEEDRERALAELAERRATVNPAGTFLFSPVGMDLPEPMRVELNGADGAFQGWAQLQPDRPRRPIGRVVVGGNEVWLVVEVPDGVLDIRLVIEVEGGTVSGTLREGLEEVPVTGRHIPAR